MAKLPAVDPPSSLKCAHRAIRAVPLADGERAKRRLGEACGLTRFGELGNPARRPIGVAACHTLEDEFVYVLTGEVVLSTTAGDADAWNVRGLSGERTHHFVNRSGAPATYLEVGNRAEGDNAFYPDDDLIWVEDENGVFAAHKDGKRY
jgi:uncharacterized cupin superfamily protein